MLSYNIFTVFRCLLKQIIILRLHRIIIRRIVICIFIIIWCQISKHDILIICLDIRLIFLICDIHRSSSLWIQIYILRDCFHRIRQSYKTCILIDIISIELIIFGIKSLFLTLNSCFQIMSVAELFTKSWTDIIQIWNLSCQIIKIITLHCLNTFII